MVWLLGRCGSVIFSSWLRVLSLPEMWRLFQLVASPQSSGILGVGVLVLVVGGKVFMGGWGG